MIGSDNRKSDPKKIWTARNDAKPDRQHRVTKDGHWRAGVPLPKKEGRRCARPRDFNLCNFEDSPDAQ
jgi:hypothetical protein